MWKIISFASKEPGVYAESANSLIRQCENFGYAHDIRIIDFNGADRKTIVLAKPGFIFSVLEESREPILWLDCDTGLNRPFRRVPSKADWDVGFVPDLARSPFFRLKRLIRPRRKVRHINSASGFAVALQPTAAAFHYLNVWKYLCAWDDLAAGGDHVRMNWSRAMVSLREQNIAKYLDGSLVVNQGRKKETKVRGLRFASID